MNTCKTCQHWDAIDPKVAHPNCTNNQRPCHRLTEESPPSDTGASVDDGYGQIETGPDFGCIHHETKVEPPKPMPLGGYRCCS